MSEQKKSNDGQEEMSRQAYAYACRLLARRDYTTYEIRTKLERKKYDPEVIKDVQLWLTKFGFLDDKEYVAKYARTRLILRPRGKYLLKIELRRKGISDDLIENYFDKNPIDESEIARELIERNSRSLVKLDPEKRRKRISYLLHSRSLSAAHFEHSDF